MSTDAEHGAPRDPFACGGGPVGWAGVSRAERAIGLAPDGRADVQQAQLPALLAAGYQVPHTAFGADCVGALLASVARDLRTLSIALRRVSARRATSGATLRQQDRDARAIMCNAAQRAEVAAELHRRLMIGLAHDHATECDRRARRYAETLVTRATEPPPQP